MKQTRRGSSLIQLVVTIGILSVVMTLVAKTMVFLMRADASGRKAVVAANGFTRLANRFRRDVHAASEAELFDGGPNAPKRLRLTMPDGTVIEYRPAKNRMKRRTIRAKKQTNLDSFRLHGTVSFEIADGPSPLITMIHIPDHGRIADANTGTKNDKQIRVEALRGYDRRYRKQE